MKHFQILEDVVDQLGERGMGVEGGRQLARMSGERPSRVDGPGEELGASVCLL